MSAVTVRSDKILQRLSKLHPARIDMSLGRMERMLADLGHPEARTPPVIHVAGTNGKGSVCAFLRAMLEAQGLQVHVYTSPHLVTFRERIRLAGALIDEGELCATLEECERVNDGRPITFFEITTAAAFLAFSRHPADAVVLEVGMGGRTDATNVVPKPRLSVMTPIGLDHQEYLGASLAHIAAEKAGIVRSSVPLVVGPQDDAALDVIARRADALGAPLSIFGQDFFAHLEHGRFVFQDDAGLLDLPPPKLAGRHQIDNAAIAVAALRRAGWAGDAGIERGLRTVEWPGRLQRLTHGPLIATAPEGAEIWLDGAHNPHAAAALARAAADFEERAEKPLYLVCGMLARKDPEGFLAAFRGLARHVTTVAIPGEDDSLGAGTLYDAARRSGIEASPADDLEDAMLQIAAWSRACRELGPPRIVICGSLALAGAVLKENG